MTECSVCQHEFSHSEALCDDWRDPNKSFGCPKCETFFVKDMNPRSSESIVGGLVGGGILTPAVFLLTNGIRNNDITIIVMSSIIIVTVFGILFSKLVKPRTKPEISSYKRAPTDS